MFPYLDALRSSSLYVTSIVMLGIAMRAARLLQILVFLQNRGRLTSVQLAEELEVAQRA